MVLEYGDWVIWPWKQIGIKPSIAFSPQTGKNRSLAACLNDSWENK
jgi:hypothetical protein